MTTKEKKKLVTLGFSLLFLLFYSVVEGFDPRHEAQGSEVADAGMYAVVRVADGDTFSVDIDGTVETVRLIGVDTPETVDPRKPVQCFGKEASDRAKSLLAGAYVRLERDASQGDTDKYGRLLRYAFLEDGTNYALATISDGYGVEYTYDEAYAYQDDFRAAAAEAKAAKRGLWADDSCAGNTKQAAI
jgi:micrococcal nuclease